MKKTPATTPAVPKPPVKKPYVKSEPTWIAMLPVTLAKEANRHRWQLTPVVASLVVFAASEAPGAVLTSVISAALAGLLFAAQKTKTSFRGRMYLSVQERAVATMWLGIVSVWSLLVLLPLPIWVDAVALTLATAYPDYLWLSSRKPVKKVRLSKAALNRIGTWADTVSLADGPLKGSKIVRATVREPAPGELTFTVTLRDDVHNKDAVVDVCVKLVERLMKLPSDCAQLLPERTDSGRIRVTLSPERHLEQNIVPWNGPEIRVEKAGDGKSFGYIPIGQTPEGKTIEVPAWTPGGGMAGRLCGNRGNGKSSTGRVITSAFHASGHMVLWLIDGKRGKSLPELKPIFDWYSIKDEEWGAVIDAAYDVMVARQIRSGAAGESGWQPSKSAPALVVWIEESPEVNRRVGKVRQGGFTRAEKVLSILQNGRADGVYLFEVSQDPMADNLLGGRPARDLMASGFEVLHKPGGKISQNLAQDSNAAEAKVNLLALPAEPGFAAVLIEGQPVATVCRIKYCTEGDAKKWAADQEALPLPAADLPAAGANYARRGIGPMTPIEAADHLEKQGLLTFDEQGFGTFSEDAQQMLLEMDLADDTSEQSADELSAVQRWIVVSLEMKGPATLGELVERCKTKRGQQWGRTHISRNVAKLSEAGSITQGDSSKWQINGATK